MQETNKRAKRNFSSVYIPNKRVVRTKAMADSVSTENIDSQNSGSSSVPSGDSIILTTAEEESSLEQTELPRNISQRRPSCAASFRSHAPSPPSQEVGEAESDGIRSQLSGSKSINDTANDKGVQKGKEKATSLSQETAPSETSTEIPITLTPRM